MIPLLVALVLKWPMRETINQKKFAMIIGISIFFSALVCCGLYFGSINKLYFKEVWNYKIISIEHMEKWTKRESRTRQVYCGRDSKGNSKYRTEVYYVTQPYGPYWNKYDEYGNKHHIDSNEYKYWAKLWANEKHVGTNKGSAATFGRAITGKIYACLWPGQFENIYPHSTIHKYINKARVSENTITKLAKPTEEQKKKYPRPVDNNNTSPIISYGGPVFSDADVMLMRCTNAFLGRKNEIHAMIVAFNAKDGRGQIREVLTAWEGTNKNELVMFVGLDAKQKVEWCEVRNWLDLGNSTVNNIWRDAVVGEVFDVSQAAKVLRDIVPKYWSRPQSETIDYLKISIHWGWGLAAFISVLAITIGTYFLVEYKIFD